MVRRASAASGLVLFGKTECICVSWCEIPIALVESGPKDRTGLRSAFFGLARRYIYVLYKRKDAAVPQASVTTADLALLYISRWKSPQAAERFAKFYAATVSQRYRSVTPEEVAACTTNVCPAATAQFATEEGPMIVEHWIDNTVIVSESFDALMASKLRMAIRNGTGASQAEKLSQGEIGLRLLGLPTFEGFEARIAAEWRQRYYDDVKDLRILSNYSP